MRLEVAEWTRELMAWGFFFVPWNIWNRCPQSRPNCSEGFVLEEYDDVLFKMQCGQQHYMYVWKGAREREREKHICLMNPQGQVSIEQVSPKASSDSLCKNFKDEIYG